MTLQLGGPTIISRFDAEIPTTPRADWDVAVIGAGAVGLTTAIALARQGLAVCLIGTGPNLRPGRTVALLEGSVALLTSLGVWDRLMSRSAPLATMRIVDVTRSLFRAPPVQFEAEEIGRPAFGYNVVNDDLEAVLLQAAADCPGLTHMTTTAARFGFGTERAEIGLAHGGAVATALVVGADGRGSLARKAAGIGVRTRIWPQTALTALLSHAEPHGNVSTEFHTREGPCTLVPLPGDAGARHRSSLVWVMDPEKARALRRTPDLFAAAVEKQTSRLLGSMVLQTDIGSFPIETSVSHRLTGPRLVLTGEAAHALPPIGAQGLNLSFRDIAELTAIVLEARRDGEDVGSPVVLDRYARRRRADVGIRTAAVDALNGSLLTRSPLVDAARGIGLALLGSVGPLRRQVMREGLVPQSAGSAGLDVTERHRRSTALL